MQIVYKSIIILIVIASNFTTFGQDKGTIPDAKSVEAYVTVDSLTPSITIHWQPSEVSDLFRLYKKVKGSPDFSEFVIGRQENEDTFYVDTDVKLGETYLYTIGDITTVIDPFDDFELIEGFGLIEASINQPAVHSRGTLILVVEETINNALTTELSTLIKDLAGDGWNVYQETVKATDEPMAIKSIIKARKEAVGCDAIFLLGHVPVPYSGIFCTNPSVQFPPDGHTPAAPPSHCGAWPADLFYANFTETWTDVGTDTSAARQANKNFPGDGKYDNIFLQNPENIPLGRVDFYDMPIFEKNEIELTRQYLTKAHRYKLGVTNVVEKGVIEDNFRNGGASREGFSSGAIRDFSAIMGKDAIVYADVLTATKNEDYMFSYVCGPGSFTSCGGFGTSDSFKTQNTAVFNQMFGSYFGDWDSKNNLMKASLASERLGLTCVWSGRPIWQTYPLGLGATFGEITSLSQQFGGTSLGFYQTAIHIALMGDPSLRTKYIKPAKSISLEASADRASTTITWTASEETDILGYYVYRSHKGHGGFVLINETPTDELSFTDNKPYKGTNHYMVRTAKVTTSGSGTYENLSLGITAEITNMQGVKANIAEVSLTAITVYPTLAQNNIIIEKSSSESTSYNIVNGLGKQVNQGELKGFKTGVDISALPTGAYFIISGTSTSKFIKQ